jgi:amino acid permease
MNKIEISRSKEMKKSSIVMEKTGATVLTTSIGIMKNIIGSGIVCLPQAMLYASIIPCLLMTSVVYVISTYSFFLIGKLCIETGCKSYKELWAIAFNGEQQWVVDVCVLGNCIASSVAYVLLFGDFGGHLFRSFGFGLDVRLIMIICHIPLQFMILPKNLDRLKPLSIVGMLAAFYFMFYSGHVGIKYLTHEYPSNVKPHVKSLSEHIWVFRAAWLSPFSTICSTFLAHYNAPRFLNEMKNKDVKSFRNATWFGFNLSLIPNLCIMIFGFLAMNSYGFIEEKKSGNIIKIFVDLEGEKDLALLVCSLLYFINILISYPFVFFAVRDTVMNLIYPTGVFNWKQRFIVSETIFFIILGIGLTRMDIADLVRLKGSNASPALCFLLPSILGFKLIKNPSLKEKIGLYFVLIAGVLSVITGTTFCVLKFMKINIINP